MAYSINMHTELLEGEFVSHTPGPWVTGIGKVREIDGEFLAVGIATEPDWTAIALINTVAKINDTDRANADLIAAAPDLLAALKGLADQWSGKRFDQGGAYSTDEDSTMIAARAAIAKAEGK